MLRGDVSPLNRARVNISGPGDFVVIPNTAPAVCKVYKIVVNSSAAVNVTVKDGASTIDGPYIQTGQGSSLVLQVDGDPHWITNGNFVLSLDSAANVSGQVYYFIGSL